MTRCFKWLLLGGLGLALAAGCKKPLDTGMFNRSMKLLASKDQDDRAAGAERAGKVTTAKYRRKLVPVLIDRLDPAKEKNPWASILAAGSLGALTDQDFGSQRRSHQRWHTWWYETVKQKLPKREELGKNRLDRVRADYLNKRGEIFLLGTQTMKAADLFRQAITLDGTKALYHSNMGLALLKLGDYDGAERRFDDALAADPQFIRAYLNKGAVHTSKAENLRAKAALIEAEADALKRAGERAQEVKARARLTLAMKAVKAAEDKAVDVFLHAAAVDKGERLWSVYHAMGRIYMGRGDFEKAIVHLEKALQLRRGRLGLYRDLAITYYGLDQYFQSLKMIHEVEKLGKLLDPGFTEKVRGKVKDMEKELPS